MPPDSPVCSCQEVGDPFRNRSFLFEGRVDPRAPLVKALDGGVSAEKANKWIEFEFCFVLLKFGLGLIFNDANVDSWDCTYKSSITNNEDLGKQLGLCVKNFNIFSNLLKPRKLVKNGP